VFSFFPSKNLGGFGDGGAVIAREKGLLRRIRMFCDHGRESKYWHEFEGMNSRLDSMKAALLRVCLPHLDPWNDQRRQAARLYDSLLRNTREVILPTPMTDAEPVYHLYVILVPDREALAAHLKQSGVETGIHYPYALNQLPAYARLGQLTGSFPNAEYACKHMLSLPLFPGIQEEEIACVCSRIRSFYGG
jgi:dTDP-4-amino-4,6-dideoxygalactose transaminase